jgi:hypothetical protein
LPNWIWASQIESASPKTKSAYATAKQLMVYYGHNDANLDDQNHLVCGTCYGANPPLVDVEIIFAQVIAHMSDEA